MRFRRTYPPDFKGKVVLEILREEKTLADLSSEYGIHPSQLEKWRDIVISGLPVLFTDVQMAMEKLKKEHAKESQDLYAEIGRLMTELSWLKKNLGCRLSRSERMALIDWDDPEISISA